jgi:hypothetical protein
LRHRILFEPSVEKVGVKRMIWVGGYSQKSVEKLPKQLVRSADCMVDVISKRFTKRLGRSPNKTVDKSFKRG